MDNRRNLPLVHLQADRPAPETLEVHIPALTVVLVILSSPDTLLAVSALENMEVPCRRVSDRNLDRDQALALVDLLVPLDHPFRGHPQSCHVLVVLARVPDSHHDLLVRFEDHPYSLPDPVRPSTLVCQPRRAE